MINNAAAAETIREMMEAYASLEAAARKMYPKADDVTIRAIVQGAFNRSLNLA